MNKKVKDHITKVREERKEKLLGVAIDIGYFESLLKGNNKEIELREKLKTLKAEGAKASTDNDDKYNFIANALKTVQIEKELGEVMTMREKLEEFKDLYKDLMKYVDFLENIDKETEKRVDEVLKLK